MSQNTFPAFTNMIPTVEDIQLIVDSLRLEDQYRITKDGIFTPGIVNQKDEYLSANYITNTISIKPFVAYTANGHRIENSYELIDLYPSGSVISVSNANISQDYENIPYWRSYQITSGRLDTSDTIQNIELTKLGKGSILHGIKLRINAAFATESNTSNVWVSIGTNSQPELFLPPTLVSSINTEQNFETDLSVMNLMYSIDDVNNTPIIITFTTDSDHLTDIINGAITVNLCIANLSGFDNEDIDTTTGGFELTGQYGSWQASTTYHIVARYYEIPSNERSLNYEIENGTIITTNSEPTRYTTAVKFYALRKTGSIVDATTLDDVKIGEVLTDENSNILKININGTDVNGNLYTEYLSIPGYRFTNNIDASQIGNGDVTNEKFSYLNSLTGNVQEQLNSKASLNSDNIFEGNNTFTEQISGSIDKVNGFTAYATPSSNSLLVLDENGKIPADALSESTVASIGNLYTVSSGATSNGRANFLTTSGTNSVVLNASTSTPLVINYSDGSVEKFTSNRTISGLQSDGFYYLVKEKNGNFVFLPTSGGTKACIANARSNGQFSFIKSDSSIGTGTVSKSYFSGDGTAYLACDSNITTGALMGSGTYTNTETVSDSFSGLPAGATPTILKIAFPEAIVATSFSACFRQNEYDLTPKFWSFEGSNDDSTYIQIATSSTDTWNKGQIKTVDTSHNIVAYKYYRIYTTVTTTTINNYMQGEETDADGYTMYLKCYYFQIYAKNNVTTGNVITEGYVQPSNASIGDYFLDISKKPYSGYKCSGANTFDRQEYVKLGFVQRLTESGTTTLTVYPFCYNTFTYSDSHTMRYWNSNASPAAWAYSENVVLDRILYFDHNLGLIPNIVQVKFMCLVANNGYSVGDYIDNMYGSDNSGLNSIKDSLETTVTSIKLHCGVSSKALYVKNKNTGVLATTSSNYWKVIIYCSRGW